MTALHGPHNWNLFKKTKAIFNESQSIILNSGRFEILVLTRISSNIIPVVTGKKETHRDEHWAFVLFYRLSVVPSPDTNAHTQRIEEETWSKRTHAADGPFRDHTWLSPIYTTSICLLLLLLLLLLCESAFQQPTKIFWIFFFQILAPKMSIIKDLKFQMITAICWIKIEFKKTHAARSLISLSRRTVQHITQSCFIPVSFCAWVGSVIYDPIHCDLFSYFTIDHLMHFQLTKLCSMFCASRRLKTRKRI